jgi:hypothetical protein
MSSPLTTNEIYTIIFGSGVAITLLTTFLTWFYESRVRAANIELENKRKDAEIALEDKRIAAKIALEDKRTAIALDMKRRESAEDYYKPLYGHISVLIEYGKAYFRSAKNGSEMLFVFKGKDSYFGEQTKKEILGLFKESYESFCSFYIGKKAEGYEIFITEEMEINLIAFWQIAKTFYENPKVMEDKKKIDEFDKSADKAFDSMEKVFGLRNQEEG